MNPGAAALAWSTKPWLICCAGAAGGNCAPYRGSADRSSRRPSGLRGTPPGIRCCWPQNLPGADIHGGMLAAASLNWRTISSTADMTACGSGLVLATKPPSAEAPPANPAASSGVMPGNAAATPLRAEAPPANPAASSGVMPGDAAAAPPRAEAPPANPVASSSMPGDAASNPPRAEAPPTNPAASHGVMPSGSPGFLPGEDAAATPPRAEAPPTNPAASSGAMPGEDAAAPPRAETPPTAPTASDSEGTPAWSGASGGGASTGGSYSVLDIAAWRASRAVYGSYWARGIAGVSSDISGTAPKMAGF